MQTAANVKSIDRLCAIFLFLKCEWNHCGAALFEKGAVNIISYYYPILTSLLGLMLGWLDPYVVELLHTISLLNISNRFDSQLFYTSVLMIRSDLSTLRLLIF